MNQSYFIKGFPDYRLVRLSESKFCVLSNKKGYWEEVGCEHHHDGHIHVCLASGDIRRYTYVHILVAEMFVPNPEEKPIVHHIDGNPTNNDPANLMFVTRSQHRSIHNEGEKNPMYSKQHTEEARRKMSESHKGLLVGEKNPMYGRHHSEETCRKMSESHKGKGFRAVEQWSKDGKTLIARYSSIDEASRVTGISKGNICSCCKDKLKSAGGYRWKYAKE